MTSSTLKERIAALQQRSTSPQSSPPRKTASGVPIPKNALRDKIARFEEKGSNSKSKAAIGLGAPAKTGEQLNVRTVSLGDIPGSRPTSAQARHVQRLGYSRSISEAHEVSRDSASSPTSSHGDTFSETYEEEFHSHPSSVLHSPRSSHSHEIHAVSISTPLVAVDNNAESLSEDLGALKLEVQNIHSPESNAESDKILPLLTNDGQEDRNKATNQVAEASKSSRPFKVALQAPEKGGNILSAESLTAEQSLSDSTISVPTSVDDSANQVLPILDAFPTVPGHIPSSHSSRSISVPSHQAVINLSAFDSTFDSKSINNISNIHSIPSSAPAPIASSCSPTVTISSNNLEPPLARPRPSQGHKTIPRPKSSVPFWYDDDSDDGEPGWVSVTTVTTRRY